MTLVQPTSRLLSASYVGRRVSNEEEQIREMVDAWGRERWSDARLVHELTVGRGSARCDMAFIQPHHFATIEVKSGYDTLERLIHQAGVFRLVSPETWIIVATKHEDGASKLIHYLWGCPR